MKRDLLLKVVCSAAYAPATESVRPPRMKSPRFGLATWPTVTTLEFSGLRASQSGSSVLLFGLETAYSSALPRPLRLTLIEPAARTAQAVKWADRPAFTSKVMPEICAAAGPARKAIVAAISSACKMDTGNV